MTPATEGGTVAKLLDFLLAEHELPNDAALAREFGRDSSYISKLRYDKLPLSANLILFIHMHFGVGVQEIFDRAGRRPRWCK